MKPEEDVLVRAERARQLLSDPLLVEALDLIEKELIDQWESCPARDKEGREAIWVYYKTAKKFRGILAGAVESGKVSVINRKNMSQSVFNMFKNAS